MKNSQLFPGSLSSLILFGVISLLAWRCSSPNQPGQFSSNELVQFINPIFQHLDVPRAEYEIDAAIGGTLSTPSGTQIHFPANALVDAQGQPITGKVSVEYREFHDAADILLSGIPMKYDNNGSVEDFQTAGMMEINANQNGQEVFISEGARVSIELASFAVEEDYDLFYLEPERNNWSKIGRADLKENEAKKEGMRLLQETPLPNKPTEIGVITDAEMVFDFGVDYSSFPELQPFAGLQWEFAGKGGKKELEKSAWAFSEVWTDISLSRKEGKQSVFQLQLANYNKKFAMDVRPVMDGKSSREARRQMEAALAEYEALMAARTEEENRLQMQANLNRAFSISSFGTYNCDRFYKRPNAVMVTANFIFDQEVGPGSRPSTVYLVTGSARAVIPYNAANGSQVTFDPTEKNRLVAVVGGNKLAVFDEKDFKEAKSKRLQSGEVFAFEMHTLPGEINSNYDLKKALGI